MEGRPPKMPRTSNESANSETTTRPAGKLNGFDRGLTPVRILGASEVTGELSFMMKFMDQNDPEIVPASIANIKCPEIVIQFYEDRLVW